jgi:hypothetical protein
MADKTIKRRLQDARDAALASDEGRFSRPSPSWSKLLKVPLPRDHKTPSARKNLCDSLALLNASAA